MTYILKKGNFKKTEDRRWLYECGHCHSDFLCKMEDFYNVTTAAKSGTYLICPVCGTESLELDEDWIKEGYIRKAEEVVSAVGYKVAITDYDGVEYTYSLDSQNDIYHLADQIPGFKFAGVIVEKPTK